ncbi:MAG: MFS transporter [Candidatus Heimdallarchaeota archaeon]
MSNENVKAKKHSNITYLSAGILMLGFNTTIYAVTQNYPIYYQNLGLSIEMLFLAALVYTLWDMFNDPIVGHLSDGTYGFTRRWGKRFPWMLIGTVALLVATVLLFSAPTVDASGELMTFLWFLVFLSAYDGFMSAVLVNYNALIPVKFKSKSERISVSAAYQFFLILGPVVGLIVVPTILETGSYLIMSIFLAGFMLVSYLLSLPGLKEDEELRESYFHEKTERGSFYSEFTSNLRQSFSQRSFVVFAVVTLCITVTSSIIAATVPYYIEYILQISQRLQPQEYAQTLRTINLPFAITSLLLIPLYFWGTKKIGHMKAFKYGLLLAPLPLLLIFVSLMAGATASMPLVMIGAGIYGICGGFIVVARIPVSADFFDESAARYGKRQEGIYLGIWNFFSRLVTAIQFGIFALIQNLTSFIPPTEANPAPTQGVPAQWGIMAQFGLVPAIALLIAGILFWRFWYLTPQKTEEIQSELEKLGI